MLPLIGEPSSPIDHDCFEVELLQYDASALHRRIRRDHVSPRLREMVDSFVQPDPREGLLIATSYELCASDYAEWLVAIHAAIFDAHAASNAGDKSSLDDHLRTLIAAHDAYLRQRYPELRGGRHE